MKLIFIFTILSIILFAPLPIRSRTNSLFTYEEAQTENTNPPIIHDIGVYDDNTIVVRVVFKNSSVIPTRGDIDICVNNYLSLRTIHPNGTVTPINISLDIQDINFCIFTGAGDPIKILTVRNKFLLVTYTVATDLNNVFTYEDWAMVVSVEDGKIYR